MSNNKKSRSNMKQTYMIRRLVAVLILILIVVAIFTRCSNRNDETAETQTELENNTTTTVPNNNVNTPMESSIIGSEDSEMEDTRLNEFDEEVDADMDATMESNEEDLQEEYEQHADVNYESDNNAFYFTLEGDSRDLVLNKDDSNSEDEFEAFWESFKEDLIKSSETLSETVQPGIELHVLNPRDDNSTILLIQDGSEIFDSTSN